MTSRVPRNLVDFLTNVPLSGLRLLYIHICVTTSLFPGLLNAACIGASSHACDEAGFSPTFARFPICILCDARSTNTNNRRCSACCCTNALI